MKSSNRFCLRCPRKLQSPPSEPCPLGIEYVLAQQEGSRRRDSEERGCHWGVASAAHGNCFWSLIRSRSDEDGRMDPFTDPEICALLGISQSMLEKTMASALAKLRAAKDTPELQEFRELVLDLAERAPTDNTMYMPDNFRVKVPSITEERKDKEELPEDLLPPEKKRKKRRNKSMPVHRDGRKTDLYGLYSRKKLEGTKKK